MSCSFSPLAGLHRGLYPLAQLPQLGQEKPRFRSQGATRSQVWHSFRTLPFQRLQSESTQDQNCLQEMDVVS